MVLLVINARLFRPQLWGLLAGLLPGLGAMALTIALLSRQHVLFQIGAGALAYLVPVAWPLYRFRRRMQQETQIPGNLEQPPGLT